MGKKVKVTVAPETDYRLARHSLKALYNDGSEKEIELLSTGEEKVYEFVMPEYDVSIVAAFDVIPEHHHKFVNGICTICDGHSHDFTHSGWTLWGDDDSEKTSFPTTTGNYLLVSDIVIGKNVEISDGNNVVICLNSKTIDLGGNYNTIFINDGSSLQIHDCDDGRVTKFEPNSSGLWVQNINGKKAVTGGCITNHIAKNSGEHGAIRVCEGGLLTFTGGNIVGNKSMASGSAVYVEGGSFIMNGGQIKGNHAAGSYLGFGAVYSFGTFEMSGGSISENISDYYAGGVSITSTGLFKMYGGEVCNNLAEYGTGVYLDDETTAYLTAENENEIVITGNTCNQYATYTPLGLFLNGCVPKISGKITIRDNNAYDGGVANIEFGSHLNNKFEVVGDLTGSHIEYERLRNPSSQKDVVEIEITNGFKQYNPNTPFYDIFEEKIANGHNGYYSFQADNGEVHIAHDNNAGLHNIEIANSVNGKVYPNLLVAPTGYTMSIRVVSDPGYKLDTLTYLIDGEAEPIDIKATKEFTLPNKDVVINATFVAMENGLSVCDVNGQEVDEAPTTYEWDNDTIIIYGDNLSIKNVVGKEDVAQENKIRVEDSVNTLYIEGVNIDYSSPVIYRDPATTQREQLKIVFKGNNSISNNASTGGIINLPLTDLVIETIKDSENDNTLLETTNGSVVECSSLEFIGDGSIKAINHNKDDETLSVVSKIKFNATGNVEVINDDGGVAFDTRDYTGNDAGVEITGNTGSLVLRGGDSSVGAYMYDKGDIKRASELLSLGNENIDEEIGNINTKLDDEDGDSDLSAKVGGNFAKSVVFKGLCYKVKTIEEYNKVVKEIKDATKLDPNCKAYIALDSDLGDEYLDLVIRPNITLDLNGYDLTVGSIAVFGELTDSNEDKGKLIVEDDQLSYPGSIQGDDTIKDRNMPVWNEDHYELVKVGANARWATDDDKWSQKGDNKAKFLVQPTPNNDTDTASSIYKEGHNIRVGLKTLFENENGEFSMEYVFSKGLVTEWAQGGEVPNTYSPSSKGLFLRWTGIEEFDSLRAKACIFSEVNEGMTNAIFYGPYISAVK